MKDMSLSIEEKKERVSESSIDKPDYPYGLKIHLEGETYNKIGFTEAPALGQKFMIMGVVEVMDVHKESVQGDDRISCTLQITHMDLKKKESEEKEKKDQGSILYGQE